MSYALTLRRPYALSTLGAGWSAQDAASASAGLPSCDNKTGNDTADASYKQCCELAKARLTSGFYSVSQVTGQITDCATKAASDAAEDLACSKVNTGISYIDEAFRDCCQGVWKGGGNAGERAKKLAVCTANATASAALAGTLAAAATTVCVAAGAATAGITTALAATGICGLIGSTVGVFLYNRISGYSTGQLIVGGVAAVVCGVFSGGALALVCGVAAAELVGWISDAVGPLLTKIFNPDSAARRERAARSAARNAFLATEKSLSDAQSQIEDEWRATINRIWDLYENAFPSASQRASALAVLGITNDYSSIAQALVLASRRFPTQAEVDRYGSYDAAQKAVMGGTGAGIPTSGLSASSIAQRVNSKTYWAGCEIYGRLGTDGTYGKLSALCPPFPDQSFLNQVFDPTDTSTHNADYYKQLGTHYMAIVKDFFAMLPMAENIVANNIATYASVKQAQSLIDSAKQQTRAGLSNKAAQAASVAEAAADAARKGNAEEGAAAVLRAKQRYDVAVAAYTSLLASYGPVTSSGAAASVAMACSRDADCKKASDAVARAKAASDLAVANAAHAAHVRVALGVGAAGAASFALYYFLGR